MFKSKKMRGGTSRAVLVCFLLIVFVFIGCSEETPQGEQVIEKIISVGAGAGLKPALDPIGKIFTERTGVKVEYNYLCSAMVLTNMQLTRQGDIMVPGSQHYMDLAIEKEVIDPESVSIAGYMIPIIAVQKGNPHNITCLEDLAKPGLKLGVGEPEALAVGRLTEKMLKEHGLYEDIMNNVVLTGGSASKLMLPLTMGNLDAEINWLATAKIFEESIDIVYIDPKKLKYSVAPIGVTTYSKNKDWSNQYCDFVESEEGQAIFAEHGFEAYFDVDSIERVR